MSVDPVIAITLRCLLALLFAAAAWHKLADLTAFRIVLYDYRVLPPALVTPATALVVVTELGLAAALPWAAFAPAAAWLAVGLLAVYAIAIAINLSRGRRTLECGCAPSVYRQPLSEWLLVRNAVLIGAAALTMLPVSPRAWAGLDWLTVAGAVLTGATTWAAAQRLLALATPAFARPAMRGVVR